MDELETWQIYSIPIVTLGALCAAAGGQILCTFPAFYMIGSLVYSLAQIWFYPGLFCAFFLIAYAINEYLSVHTRFRHFAYSGFCTLAIYLISYLYTAIFY